MKCAGMLVVLLALPIAVDAVTIRNLTTGQLLFADDFEGLGSNVSHTAYLDFSGDYDPVATVGTWNVTGGGLSVPPGTLDEAVDSDIQVTDYNDLTSVFSGPAQGNNYLRVDRADTNSSAIATLSSPMTTAANMGHVLRFETMFAVPADDMLGANGANGGPNNSSVGFSLVDANPAHSDTTTSITLPLFYTDGTVRNRINLEAGGQDISPTNQVYSDGTAWDFLAIEYAIGSDTYRLWVNGAPATVDGNPDLPLASENFIPTEIVGMRFTAGGRTGSSGNRVAQILIDALPSTLNMTVDRTTGEMELQNNSGESLNIIGYEIFSDQGALDSGQWTSIADTYDADSNNGSNTVDGNDVWEVLEAEPFELSEMEAGVVNDGATIVNSQTISLGSSWLKNPVEDIRANVMLGDGSVLPISVIFSPGANNLDRFAEGDLDFDGDVDYDDLANEFASTYLTDTSGMSPAQMYQAGDFNEDGITDKFDFLIFSQYYADANPGAPALSFPLAVPEPGSLWLLAPVAGVLLLSRRRFERVVGWLPRGCALLVCVMMLQASSASADLVAWWNLNDASGSTAADSSPNPAGGTANAGTLSNIDSSNWNMNLTGATDGITMPYGLYFPGGGNDPSSPYVNLDAHVSDFNTIGAGTISLWYRRDAGATPDDDSLIGMAGIAGENSYFRMHLENQTQASPVIRVNNHDGSTDNLMEVGNVDDGNWHHMAFTSDGTDSKLYLDGNLLLEDDLPFLNMKSWQRMALGQTPRNESDLWFFNGTMGDVRIYDEVLTQGQMSYLSNPDHYGDGLAIEQYLLDIEVNTSTGLITLVNNGDEAVTIDFYSIESDMNSLAPGGWSSLDGNNYGGANAWAELGDSSSELSEANFEGSVIPVGVPIQLGNAYNTSLDARDLAFEFHLFGTEAAFTGGGITYVDDAGLPGDFNGDSVVNLADYTVWRNNLGGSESALNDNGSGNGTVGAEDYTLWKQNFGSSGAVSAVATATVPEPRGALLLGLLMAGAAVVLRNNGSANG
ncbi:LamG domain-containing protein [Aeoliella sp.]|uniref:LamG domain-containing protein n=1 Tax=Aeoliella sp. TaxID=2795800 RepID=UPI003CCBBBE2